MSLQFRVLDHRAKEETIFVDTESLLDYMGEPDINKILRHIERFPNKRLKNKKGRKVEVLLIVGEEAVELLNMVSRIEEKGYAFDQASGKWLAVEGIEQGA